MRSNPAGAGFRARTTFPENKKTEHENLSLSGLFGLSVNPFMKLPYHPLGRNPQERILEAGARNYFFFFLSSGVQSSSVGSWLISAILTFSASA